MGRRVVFSALTTVVGVAVAGASWLLRHANPWWSSTLDNMAVVVFLLIPGEFALTRIRSGVKRIERTTDEARATSNAAMETAERTERSLEDIRQSLLDRQQGELEAEMGVFRAMVVHPSRESILEALRSATDSGLITSTGVRAPVWETDLHYRFVVGGDEPELSVQVELDDGTVLSTHPWDAGSPAEDFFQGLVDAVRQAGRDLGVWLNDPTESLQQLSEMLVQVTRLRSQELMGYRSTLRHIIERWNGWYFTESHVLPRENLHYPIAVSRLDEPDWEEHLRRKGWYDAGLALAFARRLYRL